MFDFHRNHKKLVTVAFLGFTVLSLIIAVLPANEMQYVEALPGQAGLTIDERRGLEVYVAEGCVGCHTQQVRNIEMDEVWGERPSIASDYFYSKKRMDIWRQSPSILGTERTGPDLTNVGARQPIADWHLLHLYNPRSVVSESIMPSYTWLFEEKEIAQLTDDDIVLPLSNEFYNVTGKKVVATEKVLQLVAYLQSLKQHPIESGYAEFIPAKKPPKVSEQPLGDLPDGAALFQSTCAACHQGNGQGIKGAFPPLAGSAVVNDENPELLVSIIIQGYDARPEYGQMPGFGDRLTDAEIAAIANHERTSWGNSAPELSEEEVRKIREMIDLNNTLK